MQQQSVGIFIGGPSVEHEVSLISAQNIVKALNPDKYTGVVIGMTKDSRFLFFPKNDFGENIDDVRRVKLKQGVEVYFVSARPGIDVYRVVDHVLVAHIDVVFSLLYGACGESGQMQGFFDVLGVPYVGSGVAGSAMGMDKVTTKAIARSVGVAVARDMVVTKERREGLRYEDVAEKLGETIFVKATTGGSSVGVARVQDALTFTKALDDAFAVSSRVLIEEEIPGRELECAVLGNETLRVSGVGEIVVRGHDFYSYDAKYVDPNGAEVVVPALNLPSETLHKIQSMSKKIFQALGLRGLSRIDFRLNQSGEPVLNEVNTLPGFANISMYPKLFMAEGMTYAELIDELIILAQEA